MNMICSLSAVKRAVHCVHLLAQWLYFWWEKHWSAKCEGKAHCFCADTCSKHRTVSGWCVQVQQPGAAAGHRAWCSVQECREGLTCQAAWQAPGVFPGVGCQGVHGFCADSARGMFPLSVPWKRLWPAGSVVLAVPVPQECSAGSWSAWWPLGPSAGPSSQSSFPADLCPTESGPFVGLCKGLFLLGSRAWCSLLLHSMTFLSAQFHSLCRTLQEQFGLVGDQPLLSVFNHLQTFQVLFSLLTHRSLVMLLSNQYWTLVSKPKIFPLPPVLYNNLLHWHYSHSWN